jgi:hypothetical protein
VPEKVIAGAAAIAMPRARVTDNAVGVPESFIKKETFVVPEPAASGVPESTPAEERLNPAGNVLPAATLHIYGGIPPLPASWTE